MVQGRFSLDGSDELVGLDDARKSRPKLSGLVVETVKVRLAPIVQDSPLLPLWESGLCLSPGVADRPKRLAKHHRLGQPLPNQLPNTTQDHQTALSSFLWYLARTVRQIPTPYAPATLFTTLPWIKTPCLKKNNPMEPATPMLLEDNSKMI
ncbi:hypothetical protein DY000_02039838 [Brassica cretica]|uniref:Uncharacterized protein n=1 Tax=Brassica cretica TaxID=69181 RepID=A0ABQ7BBZ0_BRACR|nr:hypothetical protein DY000_02039838 [Brassica cretica]